MLLKFKFLSSAGKHTPDASGAQAGIGGAELHFFGILKGWPAVEIGHRFGGRGLLPGVEGCAPPNWSRWWGPPAATEPPTVGSGNLCVEHQSRVDGPSEDDRYGDVSGRPGILVAPHHPTGTRLK